MKFMLAGAALVAAAAGAASAGTEVQSQPFMFALSPGDQVLSFNQFDDQGGLRVLKKVLLEVDATIGADVTAENDGPIPAPDFGVSLTGFVDVTFLSATASANIAIVESSGGVAASDGVPGSGPDFFDFGSVSGSDSDDDSFDGDLTPYIGMGTLNANIFGSGGFAVTGATDSTLEIDNFMASGTVTITYIFNIIPTPATASLLGLGGLVALRRRR